MATFLLTSPRLAAGLFCGLATARCAATWRPERRAPPEGSCARTRMAAVRRSTGRPVPRKHEPIATTSSKRLAGRRGTVNVLSSPTEHRSRPFPVPHTQGRDRLYPWSYRYGPLSAQALTSGGNFTPAFLTVRRYVAYAQHRAFLPRLGPPAPARGHFSCPRLGLTCSGCVPILQLTSRPPIAAPSLCSGAL
jgi:hypothetical protein